MESPDVSEHGSSSRCSSESREKLQELLKVVADFHESAMQELQAKVNKLKKERYLDAQKLSEFHSKNQQLREQQKIQQEKIHLLEERLRSGPCNRCAGAENHQEKLKMESDKANHEKLSLISKSEAEKASLKNESKCLGNELEPLQATGSLQNMSCSSEAEEGIIPDSPRRPLSLPVISKLKRRKEQNHVRYAEKPLSLSHPSAQKTKSVSNDRGVLVAETCEMDMICVTSAESDEKKHFKTMVPETCRMDFQTEQSDDDDHDKVAELDQNPDEHVSVVKNIKSSITAEKKDNSPSILHRRSSSGPQTEPIAIPHTPPNSHRHMSATGKRKKVDKVKSDSSLEDLDETNIKGLMLASTPSDSENRITALLAPQDSKRVKLLDRHPDGENVLNDQSWSNDPGVQKNFEESSHLRQKPRPDVETLDTDCTFVSHSLLLRSHRMEPTQAIGIGQKANDSLADIFDKTGYGDYESCPQDESCGPDEEDEDMDEPVSTFNRNEFRVPVEQEPGKSKDDTSCRTKSYACVEVVRKRDQRRKLQGHYCKECEIYYADLPEEERQKKLSSCSRHRYRYIPPSTPENFWEVGFPSTQTCKERGYINEDDQADVRIRRRRPYLATFSPKLKSQQKQN